MPYAILRHQKFSAKDWSKISASSAHCSRQARPANADPAKTNDNQWIIDRSGQNDIIASVKSLQPVKVRKNAVIAIEIVATASRDFFKNKTPEQVQEWTDASIAGIAECYGGKDNIASAVLHLDELTPHLHVHVVPLKDGKLNARHFCGGRQKLSSIQTKYHQAVAHLGLERGKEKSVAKHTTLREWYGAIETETAQLTPRPVPCEVITAPGGFLKKPKTKTIHAVSPKKANELAVIAAESRFRAEKAEVERDQYYQNWRDNEMAAKTSLLREIPLDQVAAALGYGQDKKDKHKYHTPIGAVSVNGQKFKPWNGDRGGGGAIDFVMACERQDFKTAKETLARAMGVDLAAQEIARTVYKSEKKELTKAAKAPLSPPPMSQNPDSWEGLRNYLKSRGISSAIVEHWIDKNLVYPQSFGKGFQLIFSHESGFFRKNPYTNFAGWVKGSKPTPLLILSPDTDKIKQIAIVESHVDAMAYQTLYPDMAVITTGSISGLETCISAINELGLEPIIAVDNDAAGDRAASDYPDITRHIPPGQAKDWAEVTENQKNKKLIEKNEHEQKEQNYEMEM